MLGEHSTFSQHSKWVFPPVNLAGDPTVTYHEKIVLATLHRMCVHCTIRHYAKPSEATLHRLCNVLRMSVKLFAIELIHFQFHVPTRHRQVDHLSFG